LQLCWPNDHRADEKPPDDIPSGPSLVAERYPLYLISTIAPSKPMMREIRTKKRVKIPGERRLLSSVFPGFIEELARPNTKACVSRQKLASAAAESANFAPIL
jgi:hypothetical protein